jgi:DNA polymerase III gamma/tau subunit
LITTRAPTNTVFLCLLSAALNKITFSREYKKVYPDAASEAVEEAWQEELEERRLARLAEEKRLAVHVELKRLEAEAEAEERRLAHEEKQARLAHEAEAEERRLAHEAENRRLAADVEVKRLEVEVEIKVAEQQTEQMRIQNNAGASVSFVFLPFSLSFLSPSHSLFLPFSARQRPRGCA